MRKHLVSSMLMSFEELYRTRDTDDTGNAAISGGMAEASKMLALPALQRSAKLQILDVL